MTLYEAGDYDAAGHLLVPRIERAIRRLAGGAGIPVDSSGGVLGLEDLRGVLHEPVRLYLVALLTEPAALNIRNRVSHGLVDEVDQQTAALLIQALWVLRLLQRGGGPARERGEAETRPVGKPEPARLFAGTAAQQPGNLGAVRVGATTASAPPRTAPSAASTS